MDTPSRLTQLELDWRQPIHTKWEFELWAAQDRLAALKWKSPWSAQAAIELADGRWIFDRVGFLKTQVTLYKEGDDQSNAIYEPHWSGRGNLTFSDGRQYLWRYTNVWTLTSQWSTPDGSPLLTFKLPPKFRLRNLVTNEGQIEISGAPLFQADILLLAVFGWYLRLLNSIDASTAAATAAIAA